MTDLSAIICTFNRAGTLNRTLSSLASQEGIQSRNQWELLVVDNNSTDHTREVVKAFAAAAQINVRYVFESRQGKSHALNAGITHSQGEILAFTDDDVITDRLWVASILEATAHYRYKAFGGKVLPLWPSDIPPWIQPAGLYSEPIVGGPITCHNKGDEITEYGKSMWVPIGANMFFRRESFDIYGGFRTDLGPKGNVYGSHEDSEIGFRLKRHGEKLCYYPKAIVYHPVSPSRFSRKYLLGYFWQAGVAQARYDQIPNPYVRMKAVLLSMLQLSGRTARYLLTMTHTSAPAAMRQRCLMYHLGGMLYCYASGRSNPVQTLPDGIVPSAMPEPPAA